MRYRLLLAGSIGALAAAAWLALWFMDGSGEAASHVHQCHGATVTPDRGALVPVLFISGWAVMTTAMMLPTTLPLLATFAAIARDRRDRTLLVTLVVAGYLAAWIAFGSFAYAGRLAMRSVTVGAGAILLLAGLYQFTPIKRRCLDKCRSPLAFVIEHWHGRRERWHAFRLGARHGVFCVGCCWALMLLMFVTGAASLAGMLALAIVMAIEKNTRIGARLSAPIGIALVALAALVSL